MVASETEVIPEIVDLEEKNLGITVQPEDANALADALLRLLEDEGLRAKMGEGGRDYVVRERSWKIVAEKTQKLMLEVY